jgi:hypothetical protein
MARKPETGTVRVVPAPGLRFPPDQVFEQDVTAEEAVALVATGAYIIPEPETAAATEVVPDAV